MPLSPLAVTVRRTPAGEADRAFVLALRTAPDVAEKALSKTFDAETWWAAVREHTWILKAKGTSIGYLILRPVQEVSIVLHKKYRGQGFGTGALGTLLYGDFLAFVDLTNGPSRLAFQRAGFAVDRGRGACLVLTKTGERG